MVKQYTTWGNIRGGCGHEHRTLLAAYRCLRRDQRGCAGQGGYSDRQVRAIDNGGPDRTLTGAEYDELQDIMCREEA